MNRDMVLRAVAAEPLLSSPQIAWTVRLSEEQVERALRSLIGEGLVEAVLVQEPLFPSVKLYLPTQAGLACLAEGTRLTSEEYARRAHLASERLRRLVLLAERAIQVRNLIATFPSVGMHVVGWLTFAEVDGMVLDGLALVRKPDGSYLGTVVELDAGARAKERVKTFQQLAADFGYLPGFPVVVVLCWTADRADWYLELLRRAALRARGPLLPAYVALGVDVVERGVEAPIWYSTELERMTPLFERAPGLACALDDLRSAPGVAAASDGESHRPRAEPGASRGSTSDQTGRSGGQEAPDEGRIRRMQQLTDALTVGMLDEDTGCISIVSSGPAPSGEPAESPFGGWAHETPHPRSEVATSDQPSEELAVEPDPPLWWLQDGSTGSHAVLEPPLQEVKATMEERPEKVKGAGWQALAGFGLASSAADKQLLGEVARHPLLSAGDLSVLLGRDGGEVQERLASLQRWGMVRLLRDPDGTSRYLLARRGVRYAAERELWGKATGQYARSRGWRLAANRELDTRILRAHFRHTRGVIDFFVSLAESARRAEDQELIAWDLEWDAMVFYYIGHRLHRVLPDGRGVYRVSQQVCTFLLEYERIQKARFHLKRKLYCYYAYWLSGEHRLRETEMPLVLMVTVGGARRVATIRAVACDVARELGTRVLPLLVTTHQLLQDYGPCARIWSHSEREGLHYCFPALAERPPERREVYREFVDR